MNFSVDQFKVNDRFCEALKTLLKISDPPIVLESLGLNTELMAAFESQNRLISRRHFKRIVKKYKVNPLWLLTGEGSMFINHMKQDAAWVL